MSNVNNHNYNKMVRSKPEMVTIEAPIVGYPDQNNHVVKALEEKQTI
jgi:hypothetical protein